MPNRKIPKPGLEELLIGDDGDESVTDDDESVIGDDSSWFSWLCSNRTGRSFFCSRRFCALLLAGAGVIGVTVGGIVAAIDSKEQAMTGEIILKTPEGVDEYPAGKWCSVEGTVKVDRAGSDLAPVLAFSNPDTGIFIFEEFGEFPATGAYWQNGDERFLVTSPDAMGELTDPYSPEIAKYTTYYETGPLNWLIRVPQEVDIFNFKFSLLTGFPDSKGGVIATLYSPSSNGDGTYAWSEIASQSLVIHWGAFPVPRIVDAADDWRNITAGEPSALFSGRVDIDDAPPPLNTMPSLPDYYDGKIGIWRAMIDLERIFFGEFTGADPLTVSLIDDGRPFEACEFSNVTNHCVVERDYPDTGSFLSVMRALNINVSAPKNVIRANVTGEMRLNGVEYNHPRVVPTNTVSTLFFVGSDDTTMPTTDKHSDELLRLLA